MKFLFNFAILSLVWSLYYLAKRITANVLTVIDIIICGIVVVFDAGIIVFYLYKKLQAKKKEMNWYDDMTEQEKRNFQRVIVVCAVGTILILLIPMVLQSIL